MLNINDLDFIQKSIVNLIALFFLNYRLINLQRNKSLVITFEIFGIIITMIIIIIINSICMEYIRVG